MRCASCDECEVEPEAPCPECGAVTLECSSCGEVVEEDRADEDRCSSSVPLTIDCRSCGKTVEETDSDDGRCLACTDDLEE